MSLPEPDGRGGGPSNRLIGTVAALALAAVVAAVVVIATRSPTRHPTATQPTPTRTAASVPTTRTPTSTAPAHPASTTTATPSATTPSRSALVPAGGPVPSGFAPQSFTAVSASQWWLLGTAPCQSPPCTSIVRSADSGASWVGIPAPRTNAVSDLRFADPRDGFAYGPQLWSTHDGGTHWARVAVAGTLRDLSISGAEVYLATTAGLMRAPVSGGRFTRIHGGDMASVWAQGPQVLADTITRAGNALLISGNAGASFLTDPAPGSTVECHFDTTGGADLWAQCATGTEGGVWRSADAGVSWSAVSPHDDMGEPNGAALGAASGSSAVYGYNRVFHTTDAGVDWSRVSGLGAADTAVGYLGFSDAQHGVAIVTSESGAARSRLEVTRDGGASYRPVSISSG